MNELDRATVVAILRRREAKLEQLERMILEALELFDRMIDVRSAVAA